tara:strand:+ start:5103 stop:6332 length:1230 start_codon:yes stop_codon:yes gene_type:complete
MNILIDICDNVTFLTDPRNRKVVGGDDMKDWAYDSRFEIFKPIIGKLIKNGHAVILRNSVSNVWHKKAKVQAWSARAGCTMLEQYGDEKQRQLLETVDLYITTSFVTSRWQSDKKISLNKEVRDIIEEIGKAKICFYDMGWLPDTMWVDGKGLFGDSIFADNWDRDGESIYDIRAAELYRKKVLQQTHLTSKRPQPSKEDTQKIIDIRGISGKYIYMPAQKIKDGSITGIGFGMKPQSEYDVLPTLEKVADAAIEHNIPIVIKPHPHWQCSWKDTPRIEKVSNRLNRKYKDRYKGQGSFIKILDGNTQTFMRNAMFSTSICSASIIDAILTQTPVAYTGKTMFYKSKCMKYSPNIHNLIDDMICGRYNKPEMKLYQSIALHHLNKRSLHMRHTGVENFKRLQYALGEKL